MTSSKCSYDVKEARPDGNFVSLNDVDHTIVSSADNTRQPSDPQFLLGAKAQDAETHKDMTSPTSALMLPKADSSETMLTVK